MTVFFTYSVVLFAIAVALFALESSKFGRRCFGDTGRVSPFAAGVIPLLVALFIRPSDTKLEHRLMLAYGLWAGACLIIALVTYLNRLKNSR